jgi:hypothetical protein
MEKHDGGPAFPVTAERRPDDTHVPGWDGMSLRDYFAGKALAGLLSSSESIGAMSRVAEKEGFRDSSDVVSRAAYCYADAMLAAREEGTS